MIGKIFLPVMMLGMSFVVGVSLCGCKRADPDNRTAAPAEFYYDKDLVNVRAGTMKGGKPMAMTVESKAFGPNQPIPKKYTGEGEDKSPPLAWSNVPEGTNEFALICDDPDAPTPEPWVHWVIYKIPAGTRDLPEGIPNTETLANPAGAMQGKNSWPKTGYGGPMPPRGHGVHHYHFKVYALNAPLDVKPGLDKKGLLKAMAGYVLAEGELVGTYERK